MSKIIVGNWKMNGTRQMSGDLMAAVMQAAARSKAEVVICPPVTLWGEMNQLRRATPVKLGAQDCHAEPHGAFTGDISAVMLRDQECEYVIVGHSERRQGHGESDALVAKKAAAALAAGLVPIICVGETLEERDAGKAKAIVEKQLSAISAKAGILIAYEPVWAIGTGKVPTSAEIAEMHAHIQSLKPGVPVLYGGSVKGANAEEILAIAGVSGVLVGGASLSAEEFGAIIAAA